MRHPWAVLIPALLVVVGLGSQAPRLRLEAAIDLLSPSDPVAQADRVRRDYFGEDFRLILALYRADEEGGIIARDTLATLADLHQSLRALPGIQEVSSLINARALVGTADFDAGAPLLDQSDLQPDQLEQRLHASETQESMLLSQRSSLTPVYLQIAEGASEVELANRVTALAAAVEQRHEGAGDVLIVGPVVVETSLAEHVFQDLSRLIPFSVALILVLLLVVFRRMVFLGVALLHATALLAIVLGGMAVCGLTVNLVSVLAPVILIPVGVADLLHLFVRLRATGTVPSDTAGRSEAKAILASAFACLERPMVGTSLTTAIGFLGFLVSPVAAIRQFGLTMSAGAVIALLITFTIDAALLTLLWRSLTSTASPRRLRARLAEQWLWAQRTPERLRRRSRPALAVSAVILVAGLWGLSRVQIEDTWIRNFDSYSEIVYDTLRFEYELFGTNVLAVEVEADPAVPGSCQRALDTVNRLTQSVILVPWIRGVMSATLLARSLDPKQGRPWQPWPSPTPEQMQEYAAIWEQRGMRLPRMSMLADHDLHRFQVQILVLNQSYQGLVEQLTIITERAKAMSGQGIRTRVTGNLAVNIRMVRLAVLGQSISLALLLVAVTLLAAGYTRSIAAGVCTVLPMVLAILLTFLLLVVAWIPYGIAVSMFPTLVVGLAVDFAIHLRSVLARHHSASRSRWAREVAVVVRGIVLNGAVWTAGFAILTVSTLPPNRFLGLLCSVVVALSTLLTLMLLPTAAVQLLRARKVTDNTDR
jgi:predicted RND superfamily exporter protein